jgi:hypothetical protein
LEIVFQIRILLDYKLLSFPDLGLDLSVSVLWH